MGRPSAPRRDAFGNGCHNRIEYRASDVEFLRVPVVNRSILDSRAVVSGGYPRYR